MPAPTFYPTFPADQPTLDDFTDAVRTNFAFLADAGFADLGWRSNDHPPTAVAYIFRATNRRILITGLNGHNWSKLYFRCIAPNRKPARVNIRHLHAFLGHPAEPVSYELGRYRVKLPILASLLRESLPTLSADDPNLIAFLRSREEDDEPGHRPTPHGR